MFPPGGNEGIDMGRLLQQAQQMQQQLMSAQQDISESEATGSAGGGLVRATVTGAGELTNLQIDRSVVDPDDVDTLADLVIAAVRDAHAEIQRQAEEQMGALNADVAGLFGGAGGDPSQLAGLFGGAPADALPDSEADSGAESDDDPDGPARGPGA